MRRALLLLGLLSVMNLTAPALAETYVYVSKPKENTITAFRMIRDGGLMPNFSCDVPGAPGSLTPSRDGRFLFASIRTTSQLATLEINRKTGRLSLLNTTSLADGANAAFVTPDRTDRYLFSASYAGGRIAVHAIDENGYLGEKPVQVVETTKTAHAVQVHPNNSLVLVPHVAPNAVYQYRFDAKSGTLTDIGQAPGGAAGAGPRHLAFHPSLKFAFTSNESGSGITLYAVDAETGLAPLQTLSTLPANYMDKNTTADVKVHPNGRFVWVSNRGHDSLAGFAFDEKTKTLTALERTPTAKTPRSFDIEPSGRFLYAAGEGDGKLFVYTIDTETGGLKFHTAYAVGESLSWVQTVQIR